MSAKHALLGLLLDKPGYPYELGDRLQRRLGPGWSVNPGQLYQTIDRLQRDGLIEVAENVVGHDNRNVYAITTDGLEEFERWFDEMSGRARPARRPLLAKITLAGPERLQRALSQIDAYERDRAESLGELVRSRESITLSRKRADEILLHLNLSYDIAQLEADLQWARRAREVVASLLDDDVVWPSARERESARALSDGRQGSGEIRAQVFGQLARRTLETPDPGEAS